MKPREKQFEQDVDTFLYAFEQVARPARYNEADTHSIYVPGYSQPVVASCIGRGQCKAVIEFQGVFQGLAFSWYRGHTLESAQLMVGIQGASLAAYEEIAAGVGVDQIEKPSLHSTRSTRAPSEYRIIPSIDGTWTVVEIQHRIAPENLAQTYLKLALTKPSGYKVRIPVKIRVVVNDLPGPETDDDTYGFPRGRLTKVVTESMAFPIQKIMYRIIEEAICQLVLFTRSLEGVRSLDNIPISIGIDSKLHNYRVDFFLNSSAHRSDEFGVTLKNFDNEPPNLKILRDGEPMYQGGPLYDMISEVFPDSHLQDEFVNRIQKVTQFRKLLIKLLGSIAADYYKYQDEIQIEFQWFLDVVNSEIKHQNIDETPVQWQEVKDYILNSQRSHKAFRLYLWACQLAAWVFFRIDLKCPLPLFRLTMTRSNGWMIFRLDMKKQ